MMKLRPVLCAAALLISACVDLSYEKRLMRAEDLSTRARWEKIRISSEPFVLTAYAPASVSGDTLTVYIEGDGLAWIGRPTTSGNPTSVNPMGLKLAVRDPAGTLSCLAHPCQFVAVQDRSGCARVELVGYSGGAPWPH